MQANSLAQMITVRSWSGGVLHRHGDRSKQGREGVGLTGVPHLDTHPVLFSGACTEEDKARISRYIYLSMVRRTYGGRLGLQVPEAACLRLPTGYRRASTSPTSDPGSSAPDGSEPSHLR